MKRDFTGVIIEESFDDNRIINDLVINKVKITGQLNPNDRWHMYEVAVSMDEIKKLAEHMIDTWYMHFWKGSDVVAVFSGNNVFEFNYDDKNTWSKVLEYGRKAGLPEAQLDFPIKGL
ncbi:MAG: hypothetical protein FWG36_10315 [Oscillospiraceae bacterium]|nr:hypothetical protein [Oscillospiraceae bacterium]